MGRLLFFLLLGFGAYLLVRSFSNSNQRPPTPQPQKGKKQVGTATIRCDYCGTYVPKPDALVTPDHNYCSEAHKLADEGPSDQE